MGALSSRVPAGISVVGPCLTAGLLDVFEAKLVFIEGQRAAWSPHGIMRHSGLFENSPARVLWRKILRTGAERAFVRERRKRKKLTSEGRDGSGIE